MAQLSLINPNFRKPHTKKQGETYFSLPPAHPWTSIHLDAGTFFRRRFVIPFSFLLPLPFSALHSTTLSYQKGEGRGWSILLGYFRMYVCMYLFLSFLLACFEGAAQSDNDRQYTPMHIMTSDSDSEPDPLDPSSPSPCLPS